MINPFYNYSAFIDASQRWIDQSWIGVGEGVGLGVDTQGNVDHISPVEQSTTTTTSTIATPSTPTTATTTATTNSANSTNSTITSTTTTMTATTDRSNPSHYPNVPNLITANWEVQYYGVNYPRLQVIISINTPYQHIMLLLEVIRI